MITYAKGVTDTLRGIHYVSIEEAREVYFPELDYMPFYYALRRGGIPHLVRDANCTRYKGTPKCLIKQQVQEVETERTWACITDCARDLGVSRSAIQQAIKRKGRCKGRTLIMLETEMEEDHGTSQAH